MGVAVGFFFGAITGTLVMGLVAGSKDNRDDNFSCANCEYLSNEFDFDEPCVKCKRAYPDEWKDKEGE